MYSVANQIEELYMKNSRNDMNDTLTNLIFEAILAPVLTPERLLIEHVTLIAVLHANVGTEVGKFCLHLKTNYLFMFYCDFLLPFVFFCYSCHILCYKYIFLFYLCQIIYTGCFGIM